MTPLNVEHNLSLTALVAGTSMINSTSLNISDANKFWNAFNDEIIFIGSFIPTYFLSTICVKVTKWVSNLNLPSHCQKSKIFTEVEDQNLHHAALLKASSPLSEEFRCNLSAEIYHEYSWQPYQLLGKKKKKLAAAFLNCEYKFCRSFFILITTRNFSFSE